MGFKSSSLCWSLIAILAASTATIVPDDFKAASVSSTIQGRPAIVGREIASPHEESQGKTVLKDNAAGPNEEKTETVEKESKHGGLFERSASENNILQDGYSLAADAPSIGKELKSANDEDTYHIVGALATLPPPSGDRTKSSTDSRNDNGVQQQFPQKPRVPDGRFGSRQNRLFPGNDRPTVGFGTGNDIRGGSGARRQGFGNEASNTRPFGSSGSRRQGFGNEPSNALPFGGSGSRRQGFGNDLDNNRDFGSSGSRRQGFGNDLDNNRQFGDSGYRRHGFFNDPDNNRHFGGSGSRGQEFFNDPDNNHQPAVGSGSRGQGFFNAPDNNRHFGSSGSRRQGFGNDRDSFRPSGSRRKGLGNRPGDVRPFGLDSHISEFDQRTRKHDPDRDIGNSIFVNSNSDNLPAGGKLPRPFRGEGPIIIHRGDTSRGSPILFELGNLPRTQLPISGQLPDRGQLPGGNQLPRTDNRVTGSKFGPVITTIHRGPGLPGVILPSDPEVGGPPVPDSSLAFDQSLSGGRPLVFHPNQLPTFNRPSDFGTPNIIQVPATTVQNVPRRNPTDPRGPQSPTQPPRRKYFPNLGVNVDKPSRIQPDLSSSGSTMRPNVKDFPGRFNTIGRGTASIIPQTDSALRPNRNLRRGNRIPVPGNVQIHNQDWRPSLFPRPDNLIPNSADKRRPVWLRRPFRPNEQWPTREYSYGYAVNAPSTGDHKAAYEERSIDGSVRGQYSLLQPDGLVRLVQYEADEVNGFRANVDYIPV